MKKSILKITFLIAVSYVFASCSDFNDYPQEKIINPKIVAHRGGKADFPENTILSFINALKAGADAVEMDVQISKDNVPVLYHPSNLNTWTDGNGKVSDFTLTELKTLNAAWNYDKENNYPYRSLPQSIPTLKEALNAVHPDIPITLDMKSLPASTLVESIATVLNAWDRVTFYSTSQEHLSALKAWPKAKVFEAREITRKRLLEYKINGKFEAPDQQVTWVGFELKRTFDINEPLTLGGGSTPITIDLWDKELIKAIKGTSGKTKVILFGINTEEDYKKSAALGADAVLTDAPSFLVKLRSTMNQ
ncbi:glycerophosphoryl diester phosphodiesterase [Chryseobacterium sp. H1D6B]|uniref:glycerophosphodiester phosphodiesterase family protein n=1 Tax=Chryseobacterium sp. H1D6B TaxID=2940588 RepID=UPI0015CC6432|nr:glycerophosphodiester phosphodiesterase family protein [Chryseobacterium sp. H1D6B]MDH6250572.1 glycerophosphoryl diester phosphodiesterase [Chryseobacterium sp. H1D6B]